MVENTKQVRVDNWGIFFLQRLQMFFSKTDYCDLTLQFEGNVQLKVHRLVMNACTEYFTFLEQAYPSMEEGTIMMPTDLQSDVIVPIVNFMYTGMLEFHVSIFDKLYKAAEIMNITVLMKLLDAQKTHPFRIQKKREHILGPKKTSTPKISTPELPPTLPGRKIPVWKRTNIPQHPITQLFCTDKNNVDPLMLPDNAPKPSRFEWPDEDLMQLNPLESTFENISYTSKPLLTQEEEQRVIPAASTSSEHEKRGIGNETEKDSDSQVNLFGNEEFVEIGQKRKPSQSSSKPSPKRSKNNDKENKETTISVKSNSLELDHTKIVTEILKKYPNLVKKNKNIKLKIMPMSPTKTATETKVHNSTEVVSKKPIQIETQPPPVKPEKLPTKKTKVKRELPNPVGPWICDKCDESAGPQEFVLYYLYRKHMTDVHHELFDAKLCKYCGVERSNHNLMMYHLYTKHGMRPHHSVVFPQCDKCPYIGYSDATLAVHKQKHSSDEVQCLQCKLAFTNASALTSHHQITSHINRQGKHTYDCQYCIKRLQSSLDLLLHIKNAHLKEGKRDGIICLNEPDEVEEENEEESEEGEEILGVGEVPIPKDKVKIISNVKVPNETAAVDAMQREIVPIQTGSETLNDVTASSIATNLGLVDIVVLDENQQYILQDNQTEQTEFILPELTTGESPFSGQVITTQHSTILPQGVLQTSETDIGSADELVMVLTDHDYQDEQEGDNTNNSNIVVLYSHPVDGQGQFITSQGNLMVNSQTGMLEIRDGVAIETTTANQIVVNNRVDAPIESIEMIQKEIESQNALKQEPYFEEEKKPAIQQPTELVEQTTEKTVVVNESLPEEQTDDNEESGDRFIEEEERLEQTEIVQNTSQENEDIQTEDQSNQEIEQGGNEGKENEEPQESSNEEHDQTAEKCTQDFVDGHQEEAMEIEEITEMDVSVSKQPEKQDDTQEREHIPEDQSVLLNNADNIHHDEEGEDVPPDSINTSYENDTSLEDKEETEAVDEETKINEHDEIDEGRGETEENEGGQQNFVEPMEVDGKVVEREQLNENVEGEKVEKEHVEGENIEEPENINEKENENNAEERNNMEDEELDKKKDDMVDAVERENEETVDKNEIEQEDIHLQEQPVDQDDPNQPTELREQEEESQNEEDSVFQDSSKLQETSLKTNSNIDKTILEDWEEDTDSQHSERQKEKSGKKQILKGDKERSAAEVNKLMDDWEEEDEDK